MESVVSEFEGTLIKERDLFSYLMLVAFEASGLIRFALLLMLWPLIRLLEVVGEGETGLKLMIFVAVAGVREAEIESVARAVLPKFYADKVDLEAWRVFNSHGKRVVVTKQPRVMVETFLKKHLLADEVLGAELVINKFGFATGFTKGGAESIRDRVARVFVDEQPSLGLGRVATNSFLSLCNEQRHPPFFSNDQINNNHLHPPPVIFHDGRLVKRPTPATALLIILWIPIGIVLAVTRILIGVVLPMRAVLPVVRLTGNNYVMRGNPPPPPVPGENSGVLFVCTHRTLMDPVALSIVLGRKVAALTYSLSKVTEALSPIPTVRLTRDRDADAGRIRRELARGDLAVCPEGTTCREPFLLRFSALFAELTDRIVPVAMEYRAGGLTFFHATTARGWKGLDIVFYAMNPRPVYEVTFLDKLPAEDTCSAGKSPHDVANDVQRALAATLGFECTNFTRKDKYRVLAGNDGTAS